MWHCVLEGNCPLRITCLYQREMVQNLNALCSLQLYHCYDNVSFYCVLKAWHFLLMFGFTQMFQNEMLHHKLDPYWAFHQSQHCWQYSCSQST